MVNVDGQENAKKQEIKRRGWGGRDKEGTKEGGKLSCAVLVLYLGILLLVLVLATTTTSSVGP